MKESDTETLFCYKDLHDDYCVKSGDNLIPVDHESGLSELDKKHQHSNST